MQRMTGRAPSKDTGRLSRSVVWLGVVARLGVSACFLILAGWNWVHHSPPLLIAAPVVLALIGGALAIVLALGQRD
jgi:hypothetical protein